MELNPHEWHRRPRGSGQEDPCPLCGCPAAGTRRKGYMHRAALEGEALPFAFIVRYKSMTGWQQKGLCPAARTALHVRNDVLQTEQWIDAHYPRSAVIPRLIQVFAAYEKCADTSLQNAPLNFSLRIAGGRKIEIGIHPAGELVEAQTCLKELLAIAGDALDLLRDYNAERSAASNE